MSARITIDVADLPLAMIGDRADRRESPWRRGWWRASMGGMRCCQKECGRQPPEGAPVYLSGRAGEVFCVLHAKGQTVEKFTHDLPPAMLGGSLRKFSFDDKKGE